jgi:hypothetical protein
MSFLRIRIPVLIFIGNGSIAGEAAAAKEYPLQVLEEIKDKKESLNY